MKHSELKQNDLVLFYIYSDILKRNYAEIGTVIYVREDTKEVMISWLCGYRTMVDDVSFDKVIAKIDKDNGKYSEVDGVNGYFIILEGDK